MQIKVVIRIIIKKKKKDDLSAAPSMESGNVLGTVTFLGDGLVDFVLLGDAGVVLRDASSSMDGHRFFVSSELPSGTR